MSDKRLRLYKGQYFTDGQTPLQLRAFSEAFRLHVLSPVTQIESQPKALLPLEGDIAFHSLGKAPYFLSIPQPWIKRTVEREVRQCIRDIRPDIVIAKAPREVGLYAILTAASLNVPTLLSYDYDWFADIAVRLRGYPRSLVGWYENWISRYRLTLTRAACQAATTVTTVSRSFSNHLQGICGREVPVLTNCYSLSKAFFTVGAPGEDVRFRVLFVGRIDRNKNLDSLARAFRQIKMTYPRAHLTIVGDGPYLPTIRALVRSLDMEDAVAFRSYVRNTDLTGILANAGVLVLPSFSEALGQALLEAMAAGRPVIGSNTGGIPELIRDGENGILIDPHKTESLTVALYRIMNDWPMAVLMGKKGREVATQYTPEAAHQRWIDAVNNVLRSNQQ